MPHRTARPEISPAAGMAAVINSGAAGPGGGVGPGTERGGRVARTSRTPRRSSGAKQHGVRRDKAAVGVGTQRTATGAAVPTTARHGVTRGGVSGGTGRYRTATKRFGPVSACDTPRECDRIEALRNDGGAEVVPVSTALARLPHETRRPVVGKTEAETPAARDSPSAVPLSPSSFSRRESAAVKARRKNATEVGGLAMPALTQGSRASLPPVRLAEPSESDDLAHTPHQAEGAQKTAARGVAAMDHSQEEGLSCVATRVTEELFHGENYGGAYLRDPDNQTLFAAERFAHTVVVPKTGKYRYSWADDANRPMEPAGRLGNDVSENLASIRSVVSGCSSTQLRSMSADAATTRGTAGLRGSVRASFQPIGLLPSDFIGRDVAMRQESTSSKLNPNAERRGRTAIAGASRDSLAESSDRGVADLRSLPGAGGRGVVRFAIESSSGSVAAPRGGASPAAPSECAVPARDAAALACAAAGWGEDLDADDEEGSACSLRATGSPPLGRSRHVSEFLAAATTSTLRSSPIDGELGSQKRRYSSKTGDGESVDNEGTSDSGGGLRSNNAQLLQLIHRKQFQQNLLCNAESAAFEKKWRTPPGGGVVDSLPMWHPPVMLGDRRGTAASLSPSLPTGSGEDPPGFAAVDQGGYARGTDDEQIESMTTEQLTNLLEENEALSPTERFMSEEQVEKAVDLIVYKRLQKKSAAVAPNTPRGAVSRRIRTHLVARDGDSNPTQRHIDEHPVMQTVGHGTAIRKTPALLHGGDGSRRVGSSGNLPTQRLMLSPAKLSSRHGTVTHGVAKTPPPTHGHQGEKRGLHPAALPPAFPAKRAVVASTRKPAAARSGGDGGVATTPVPSKSERHGEGATKVDSSRQLRPGVAVQPSVAPRARVGGAAGGTRGTPEGGTKPSIAKRRT